MKSESQWTQVGVCTHCNSPILKMEDKVKFTGVGCRCELKVDEQLNEEEEDDQL